MTPRQKAFQLIQSFGLVPFNYNGSETLPFEEAKRYAITAVELLIKDEEMYSNGEVNPIRYWASVKEEIINYNL